MVTRRRNSRARRPRRACGKLLRSMGGERTKRVRVLLDVTRRCLVCDFEEAITESEDTDVLGPLCSRCRAPSERIAVHARRTESIARNPHAAALGRLGGLRGGVARAAALSPRRRREIARAAARARWKK
jgi:CRISPR/Cas system-associated protein Cas10 (large subunit of type III CRISPR-Cas system)